MDQPIIWSIVTHLCTPKDQDGMLKPPPLMRILREETSEAEDSDVPLSHVLDDLNKDFIADPVGLQESKDSNIDRVSDLVW